MTGPLWYEKAKAELGVREYTKQHPGPHGEQSNVRVEEYQLAAGQRRPDDDVSWCASFVSWLLAQCGLEHLATGARAYAKYGQYLADPRLGCIAAMWREDRNGTKGHVTIFVQLGPCVVEMTDASGQKHRAVAAQGEFVGLGGNQGDRVTIAKYPLYRLLSWRWPTAAQLERAGLDGEGVRRPT